jgi:hypothetical protein
VLPDLRDRPEAPKEASVLTEKQKDYHRRRARQEMDMAYRAEGGTVANAHMKLSALHMSRIAEPDEPREAAPRQLAE